MKKIAIVINGAGGVGKDTLCNMAARHFRVRNLSSVDPIKAIAAQCGWDGTKDARSRRFLSDLKALCIAYNDFPTRWAADRYREFLASEDEVFFFHIREPEEIRKFVDATGGAARTLLVRGGARTRNGAYGNASDDGVENYRYDVYFVNDRPLAQTEAAFTRLIADMLAQA